MVKQLIALESFQTADAVAARTADRIMACAARAIAARGSFSLVLAGGRTPLAAYTRVAGRPADWSRWHVFFGDERCLPVDHPGRNSLAAADAFLDRVAIPAQNRHPIPAELGAERAAADYAALVAGALPFDLVLLGIGEDGHTASLFPGSPPPEHALVTAVHDAPKPPPDRVSLTPGALAACRDMLIIATGHSKRDALAAWLAGVDLPVVRVASLAPARVLADQDALEGLAAVATLPGWAP